MVKLMPGLNSLGINANYREGNAHYEFDGPKNIGDKLRAISKDASRKGCLDNLDISVKGFENNPDYQKRIRCYAHDLLKEAKESEKNGMKIALEEHSWPIRAISKGLIYGGALTGLVVGYTTGAEIATDIAQNNSSLLSPLIGLAQFGAGLLSSGVGALVGTVAGVIGGAPVLMVGDLLSRKNNPVERYERLERALVKSE